MKNFRFFAFLSVLFLFFPRAFAVSDLTLSGEFNLLAAWKQLPTRDQGVTAFSIPSIRMDFEVPLHESNEIFVELESAEFRDATSKRYDTQAKEAYLSLVSLFTGVEIRYGLIPNSWVEMQRGSWDYDFWGPTSETFLIKYKYSSWADLGVDVHGEFGDDFGEWTLSGSNGEGAESEELGRHKEYMAILSFHRLAPLYFTVSYLQGAYERIDDSFNQKKRIMAEISYATEITYAGISYYNTADPADAITAGKMAGEVDVVSLAGTSVEGQGASLLLRRKITARTDIFARADWLSPVKTQRDKNLRSVTGGVSFQSNEDLLWVLAAESTTYSETFAPAARDQSQFLAATQVKF